VEELIYAPVSSLANAIRAREVSSEEVVAAHLQCLEDVNPQLNAVVQVTKETARGSDDDQG
jgi:amidase